LLSSCQRRGVKDQRGILKYSAAAAGIAAAGLILIYISYLSMGAHSPVAAATNGLEIISHYVATVFGAYGRNLLAVIITLACLVTSIGLTTGTARYFSHATGLSYGMLVASTLIASAAISVLGLNSLIAFAVPVLCAIYPAALVVLLLGIVRKWVSISDNVYRVIFYSALVLGVFSLFAKS